jgi:hypothetical protein
MRAIADVFTESRAGMRTRVGAAAVVGILMLPIPSTVAAEEPEPITPSYCRLGGCLWEAHEAGRTKYHGKKKVKKNELVRIACGYSKKGEGGGIRSIDGRLLLDKEGHPTACYGGGTIYTTAGAHTIGIEDKEFTIDFEPVTWYTFDWNHYSWKNPFADNPGMDPQWALALGLEAPTVVFGQGKFGNAKKIILAATPDHGWDWYHGPLSE